MAFLYRVCGFVLESDLELPELQHASGGADVFLRFGSVPEHLDQPISRGVLFEAGPEGYLLRVASTGRFLVRDGREITLDVVAGASPRDLRALLLGPAITAVLHQRGALVMHAASVVGARGAVILAGDSGQGKSTLLAALARCGYRVLADDTTALTLTPSGSLEAQPAFPFVKLWRDALQRMGDDTEGLTRSMDHVEKYSVSHVPLFHAEPVAPVAMFVLRVSNDAVVKCEPVADSESFAEVRLQTRALRALEGLQLLAGHFQLAAKLAASVPIHRLTRPRDADSVDALVRIVEPFLI